MEWNLWAGRIEVYGVWQGEVYRMRILFCLLLGLVIVPSLQAQTKHWAYQKPVRSPVPKVKQAGWVQSPIDAFILWGLEKRGLTPSVPADKITLLRRVTFDLTGLPPTPQEITAFVADKSLFAYEKLVKRLLASPQYGERWAQHWLDVVRFAETNGYELDAERPQAWRYRDYVVNALNSDKPYDRFLLEQIAGDELEPESFEARVATGFLRAGPRHVVGGNQDEALNRQEWLTEAVNGIGNAVMGITVGCARCHDHKYDPISQKDYYGLQAFLAGSDDFEYKRHTDAEKSHLEEAIKAHSARLKPLKEQVAEIEKPYYARLHAEKRARLDPATKLALETPTNKRTPEQKILVEAADALLNVSWDEMVAALSPVDRERRANLRKQLHALEWEAPTPLPIALGVAESQTSAPETHLLVRGDPHTLGAVVSPDYPHILKESAESPSLKTGRRLALARWLVQPQNPLTARVMVNRLWHYYFGKGLVRTPNDFGVNGERPTHPELLDWLATEFVRQGWSLKKMHRLIVLSNTYRQSSAFNAKSASIDPENRSLWRQNRKRLDAEALRDSLLTASGAINLEREGESIRVPLEPEIVDTIFTESEPDNLWPIHPDPKQHSRRSLYLLRKRNVRLPLLAVFDMPDRMLSCAARGQSVSALQPLTLLNSPFIQEQSRLLAERLLKEPLSGEARLNTLFLRTLNRLPTAREKQTTLRFLHDQQRILTQRGESNVTLSLWADLSLAMFNLNDFVMVR